MPRLQRALAVFAVLLTAVAVSGCVGSASPAWTFSTATSSGSSNASQTSGSADLSRSTTTVGGLEIEAFDLGFKPAMVSVPAAGQYAVTFKNAGATTHDLTFADGAKITAEAGQTATGEIDVPAAGTTFKCSIPGHADAGMTGSVTVSTNAAARTDSAVAMPGMSMAPSATSDPNAAAPAMFDPNAPAVLPGTVHDVDMPIVDKDITVAPGFVVRAWTFGGQVPGPTIRVHLGDTVRVHLTNETQMSHSIDFHASQTAMNDQMVEIKPGSSFTYTFKADYAGVWMYHCGSAPALEHIANGMFGMVIVEPKGGLPKVDREYAFVQSEWYLGANGQPADYTKANAAAPAPDYVVFNGVANQYKDHPIEVPTKGRIRVFVLDAGPNVDSSFHVVGTIFDTVVKEGIQLVRGNAGGWGSQAVDLSPAQGAIIEFSPQEDGMYPMVTHAFNLVGKGAIGVFSAGDGDPKN